MFLASLHASPRAHRSCLSVSTWELSSNFGKVPVVTRYFCASTFHEVPAWLSVGYPRRTAASETSFSRRTSTSWCWWNGGWSGFWSRFSPFISIGNYTCLLSSIVLLLSIRSILLVLFQHHEIPCDSLPLLLSHFSRFSNQNSLIEVSDQRFSSPSSSIFEDWASISSDESPFRTFPIRFWVARSHVFPICTDFPRYHRTETLTLIIERHPILYRLPEYGHHEEQQRIHQHNPILYHDRQSLESSSSRSWRPSVFLVETDPLPGLSAPRDWLSYWTGNSEWSCSEQAEAIFASSISKFGKLFSRSRSRRSQFVQRINHFHFLDPQHCFRWIIRTGRIFHTKKIAD